MDIHVMDEPGLDGAYHQYELEYGPEHVMLWFQKGPINEVGANGITQEALIAICIHRLRCFQEGPYACRENALALTRLEEALLWLRKRTCDRLARGVEGTNEK